MLRVVSASLSGPGLQPFVNKRGQDCLDLTAAGDRRLRNVGGRYVEIHRLIDLRHDLLATATEERPGRDWPTGRSSGPRSRRPPRPLEAEHRPARDVEVISRRRGDPRPDGGAHRRPQRMSSPQVYIDS
jgi:hypothetical protein